MEMWGIYLLIILTAIYWISAILLIFYGAIKQNKTVDNNKRNKGKMMLIIGVIMLIVGIGYCGTIMS